MESFKEFARKKAWDTYRKSFATTENAERILRAYAEQGFTHVVMIGGEVCPAIGDIPPFALPIGAGETIEAARAELETGNDYSHGAHVVRYERGTGGRRWWEYEDEWCRTGFEGDSQ